MQVSQLGSAYGPCLHVDSTLSRLSTMQAVLAEDGGVVCNRFNCLTAPSGWSTWHMVYRLPFLAYNGYSDITPLYA